MSQWVFLSFGNIVIPVGRDIKTHSIFCPGLTSFLRFGRLSPARSGRDGTSYNNNKRMTTDSA